MGSEWYSVAGSVVNRIRLAVSEYLLTVAESYGIVAAMTRKTAAAPPIVPEPAAILTVREFVAQLEAGHTLSALAKESGVPFTSLSTHVRHPTVPLSVENAKKLQSWSQKQTWSKARISAAKTLGVDDEVS